MREFFADAADLTETWDTTADVPIGTELRTMLEQTLGLMNSGGRPDKVGDPRPTP